MKSLQSCAQDYPHASSNANSRCQSRGGQRMGKARRIVSMTNDSSKQQKRGHQRCRERAKNSSFCNVEGHLSSQKNSELEPQIQKYKCRIVLRGDIVTDDPGSYAVFTEQGKCACQMTTAKVMDVIARLPGCAREAADAVSAYTQVKMKDAPKLLKHPKSECQDVGICLPRHKWQKSWSNIEDPVVPRDRNLYGHPLAGLLWERQNEKVLLGLRWEKVPNWECLFIHRKQGLFLCECLLVHRQQGPILSVNVDNIKMSARKQNLNPMWKQLMNLVDRHQFLTTCNLDALNLNASWTKVFVINSEKCSNHESPPEQLKSYLVGRNRTRIRSLGLMISDWPMSIMSLQTQNFLTSAPCFTFSKTTKQ